MAKKGCSWFNTVKRAFRSRSKDAKKDKEKAAAKKNKKKWTFCGGKAPLQGLGSNSRTAGVGVGEQEKKRAAGNMPEIEMAEEKHAIEIAVESAQAAVKLVRLTPPGGDQHLYCHTTKNNNNDDKARRAVRALKGLVRLQAPVRGYNMHTQTNTTLRCMQALLRVQARVRDGPLLVTGRHDHGQSLSQSQHRPPTTPFSAKAAATTVPAAAPRLRCSASPRRSILRTDSPYLPKYMAATESSKAKARQRPRPPEKEPWSKSTRKRWSPR